MKLSSNPRGMKIKLTKIIDNSKGVPKFQNQKIRSHPLRLSAKQTLNHLPSSQFIAGKQFSSIDHRLYKRIIFGNSSQSQGSKIEQNIAKCTFQNSIVSPSKNYAFIKKHQLFYQSTNINKERQYAGRLSAKEYYKKSDFTNTSSPLDAWKQLSKSYQKITRHNDPIPINTNECQQSKKLNDKSLELVINRHKQNLPEHLYKAQNSLKLQEVIKKWKERQQARNKPKQQERESKEGQLEENIVLRKSLSCKISLNEFQRSHCNIDSFITEQNELPGLKKQPSKKYCNKGSLPTQANDQSPIVLIHKQPLDDYMQIFFESATQVASSKPKQRPLELIRIRSKKLSTRNVECLEKLKKNLFKEKSTRDLFSNDHSLSPKSVQKSNVETAKTLQSAIPSPNRSRKQSFCKFLKPEGRKSVECEKIDMSKAEPTKQEQSAYKKSNEKVPETPQRQKTQLNSSRITFSEQPTPQMPRTSLKGHSLINAW